MQSLVEYLVLVSSANLSMLLGATIYESVVMAPNYKRGIEMLRHIRAFFATSTPARYFRPFSAITQALLLVTAVFAWLESPGMIKWYLLAALVSHLGTDVITFSVHYPRNRIMFTDPLERSPAEYEKIARQWAVGNYARIALLVLAVIAVFSALTKIGASSGI